MMAIIVGAAAAAIWLYLIVFRGRFWWPWPAPAAPAEGAYRRSVVAVIPARNEAEVIAPAITSLLRQRYPGPFRTVLVDDHSTDATVETAQDAARVCAGADRLTILSAPPVAEGWTGKLWALRHGIAAARRFRPDYLLLTDADIVHADDNLAQLVGRAESGSYDLVSLMVRLHCRSFWERLLIPAFVFFFFKLYPPRWVADPRRRTAAAAGGCVLIRRESLDRIGGVDQIRREIIDDCALARRVKCVGRVWLGASQATSSIREYGSWRPIWRMIARCAFAQLGFSPAALILTVAGMVLIYIGPPLLLLSASSATAAALGAFAWLGMSLAFMPVLWAYGCPILLAPLLPGMALFYTAATIGSAILFWRGRGGYWKGRVQAPASVPPRSS